ncbi:MAG: hypothetical protein U9O95_00440 [Candidatus Marinimicrobia bacterium]|nr:hypothetical protein [Candidatus Neomarinimicrobiota bacterium]
MRKYLLIFILLFVLSACFNDDDPEVGITIDATLAQELLNDAVDTLCIDSLQFILEAYLWRDFMPISPIDGKPLISINWLVNLDSVQVPLNLDMTKQYVILNDSIWISDYSDESRMTYDYKLENISRNGPKWGPHIEVDVISKITDSTIDTVYFIKAENVVIDRTD